MSNKLNQRKKYSISRIIGKAINTTFLTGFTAGALWTGVEGAKEIIETKKGDNQIIDFDYGLFSLIFKSNETRSLEQLLTELEDAIIEVENIEKAFSEPHNLTREQKEQIIKDIINSMAETAHLNTDNFKFEAMQDMHGYYYMAYNEWSSISTKTIKLNEVAMDEDFSQVVITTIHEMMHAVQNENTMRSDLVIEVDKQAFFVTGHDANSFNRPDYISAVKELLPQLFAARMNTYFEANYGTSPFTGNTEAATKNAMLFEMILNLYNQKVGLPYNFTTPPTKHQEIFNEDVKGYKLLPIKNIIELSLTQKFERAEAEFTLEEVQNSRFYEILEYYYGETLMNVRYIDYVNQNYNVNIENVKENIDVFEDYLFGANERSKEFAIVEQIAAYVNIFRYHTNDYSNEDKALLKQTIFKYLDDISEEYITEYGLQDAQEVLQEHLQTTNTNKTELELEL
jgi:hypothetical protein